MRGGEGRTQFQILQSNPKLQQNFFFWKFFQVPKGGVGEGWTQIQILESNHELQKKNKFSKSRGGEGRTQIQILELNHELPKKKF